MTTKKMLEEVKDDVEDDEVVLKVDKETKSLIHIHNHTHQRPFKLSSKLEESWFKFLLVRSLIFIAVLGTTWYCTCFDESSGGTEEEVLTIVAVGESLPTSTATAVTTLVADDETQKSSRISTTTEEEPASSSLKEELNDYFTPQLTKEIRSYWETTLSNVSSYQNQTTIRERALQSPPLPQQQGDNITPSRSCGQLISVTSLEDAKQIAERFLNVILPPDILSNDPSIVELAKSIIFGILQYGVATYKVCLSCQDVMNMELDGPNLNSDDPLYGFQSYCSSDSPSYDVVYSALMMVPLVEQEILSGQLPVYMYGRSLRADLSQSVTELWPSNDKLQTLLQGDLDEFLFTFQSFLSSMAYASTGGIAIIPDFLGYGESYKTSRTTGILHVPYQQAFTLGYLATLQHIQQTTNGCTIIKPIGSTTISGKVPKSGVKGCLVISSNA